MGWKVVIGSTTIDANHRFDLTATPKENEAGKVEYVDVFVEVEGQVVESTPSAVADKTKTYFDLAATAQALVSVSLKLDDVAKFEFTPAASLRGPTVVDFHTIPDDGAGGSLWRYSLTIYLRLPGNNFQGLYDLQTSLVTIENASGDVVRKIWKASARAKTLATAKSAILGFKPSGSLVLSEVEEFYQERRATGLWIWERNLTSVVEVMRISGRKGWVIDPQVGKDAAPLLHEARLQPIKAVIIGRARGPAGAVEAPKPHFKESKTMKRQEVDEENGKDPTFVSEEDRELGMYTIEFMEVWLCTDKKLPKADHGDHAAGKEDSGEKEPLAGKIALSAGG